MPAPILLIIITEGNSGISYLQRILSLANPMRKLVKPTGFEPALNPLRCHSLEGSSDTTP